MAIQPPISEDEYSVNQSKVNSQEVISYTRIQSVIARKIVHSWYFCAINSEFAKSKFVSKFFREIDSICIVNSVNS